MEKNNVILETEIENINSEDIVANFFEILLSSDEEVAPIVLDSLASLAKLYPSMASYILEIGQSHLIALFECFQIHSRIGRALMRLIDNLILQSKLSESLFTVIEPYLISLYNEGLKQNKEKNEKSQNRAIECFTV